jgi:hypothetical protein
MNELQTRPAAPPELLDAITRIVTLDDEIARLQEQAKLLRNAVATQFAADGMQDLLIEGLGKVSYRAGYTYANYDAAAVEKLYGELEEGEPLRHELDRVRKLVPQYDSKRLEALYPRLEGDLQDRLFEARSVREIAPTVAIRKER